MVSVTERFHCIMIIRTHVARHVCYMYVSVSPLRRPVHVVALLIATLH